MDEKNTCDGRRTDRSCLDYQGVNDFQDTNSVICVHDPKKQPERIYISQKPARFRDSAQTADSWLEIDEA